MNSARARLLRHAGPVVVERISAGPAPAPATIRLEPAARTRLVHAVVEPPVAAGLSDAVLTLLSGPSAELASGTGVADPSGARGIGWSGRNGDVRTRRVRRRGEAE